MLSPSHNNVQAQLPLLRDTGVFSYPKASNQAPHVRYFSLSDILTRAWTSDAHTTAYSVEAWPYRLSKDAVTLNGGVLMVLFIADIDCALSHAASGGQGDVPAPDEWWLAELEKLEALRQAFPGTFVYRTLHGYRVIYWSAEPRLLCSYEDAEVWKETYLAWCAALHARFQIAADASCKDWQRLYRVPHATRIPHGRPEARETLGNPYQIGVWTCDPTAEERACAKTLATRPTTTYRPHAPHRSFVPAGDGLLFQAFQSRGWIGEALEPGKWSVRCPWETQHSEGNAFDTSTVLFAPRAGDTLGWLHCSHAHCQGRDVRDVLALFSQEELERAGALAGVHDGSISQQGVPPSALATTIKGTRWGGMRPYTGYPGYRGYGQEVRHG